MKRRRREVQEKSKAWNLHKFETSPWYGTTINLFLSKLCRKIPTRNVVDWYEMGVMVYFEFWVELVFGFEGNFGENGSKLAIYALFDTPTPRRRIPRLGVELRLGESSFA